MEMHQGFEHCIGQDHRADTYELDMYDYLGIIQDQSYWNSVQTEFVGIGSGIATGANGLWLSLTHPINTIDQVVTGFYAAVSDFDGSARILISNLRQMWGQLTGGDPKVSGEKLGELVFAAGTAAVTGPVVGAAGEGIGAASRFVGGLIPEVEGVSIAAETVANPVPSTLARVIPGSVNPTTLGRAGASDVFVTAADDIAGMNAAQIQQRLAIQPSSTYQVIEFPTPSSGLASPVNRFDPGFIGGGRTAGGAREFVLPNGPIPPRATIRTVP